MTVYNIWATNEINEFFDYGFDGVLLFTTREKAFDYLQKKIVELLSNKDEDEIDGLSVDWFIENHFDIRELKIIE